MRGREDRTIRAWSSRASLLPCAEVKYVLLKDINQADRRFQHRLSWSNDDIRESLKADGQLVPVALWGTSPPYLIIDGFRRIETLTELGADTVSAVIHADLSEQRCYAVSFIENVRRKSYSAMDRANAIRIAGERGLSKVSIAQEFQLSERQIDRYLGLMAFNPTILLALDRKVISMAHAAVIHRHTDDASEAAGIIEMVAGSRTSASDLKRKLRRRRVGGRPTSYLVRTSHGFRLSMVHCTPRMQEIERRRILHALEEAAGILKGWQVGRPDEC